MHSPWYIYITKSPIRHFDFPGPLAYPTWRGLHFIAVKWHFPLVYIGDKINFSRSADEHIEKFCPILLLLPKETVTMSKYMCKFFTEKANYFGHVIYPCRLGLASHRISVQTLINNTEEFYIGKSTLMVLKQGILGTRLRRLQEKMEAFSFSIWQTEQQSWWSTSERSLKRRIKSCHRVSGASSCILAIVSLRLYLEGQKGHNPYRPWRP